MIELTDNAKERFDKYLHRLRSSLRGIRSVEPDEVEQNVREHVELALAGTPVPVGAEHLGAVLDRLGPPERWLPEEERPAWKLALDRMWSGPEDWRLAYVSFGLFFLAIVLLPIGGLLLLIPAFLLSRATVSLLAEKNEPIGARKWLVYPSIAMLLFFAAGLILIAPAIGMIAWGIEEGGFSRMAGVAPLVVTGQESTRLIAGFALMSFGVWWLTAPVILAVTHRPLQRFFRPLLDGLGRKQLAVMAVAGLVLTIAGLVVLRT